MFIRGILAAFLLVLGGILTIPASIAIWQERTVLDEDNFVETVDEVFEDDDVQAALASRMTDVIMEELEVQGRLHTAILNLEEREAAERLPGLTILEGPITRAARDAIYNVCIRILDSEALEGAREALLRTTHRAVTALVLNDGEYLEANGEQVVLNLRPLIGEAIRELAGEDAVEAAAERVDEDFGRVVLVEDRNNGIWWKLAGWIDDINPVIPIISIAVLVLAVFVSRDRVRMVGRIGGFLVVVAGLVLLALAGPVKDIATSWPPRPEGQEAVAAIYEILLDSFRVQQVFIGVIGIGMVAFSAVARDPEIADVVKRARRREATEGGIDFRAWVIRRMTTLRIAGLGIAAFLLLFWPDATTRVYATVLVIAVLYFGLLTLVASEAQWAYTARAYISRFFDPGGERDTGAPLSFVARWGGWLRVAGVAVAALFLVLAPDISTRTVFLVIAATLLYLGAIEYFASREPDGHGL
jgi:hypothetical protein